MHRVAHLRANGVPVIAMVGDFSPLEAIRDEIRQRDYDEIMISTLPSPISRWLRSDLLTRVAGEFSGRVIPCGPKPSAVDGRDWSFTGRVTRIDLSGWLKARYSDPLLSSTFPMLARTPTSPRLRRSRRRPSRVRVGA